MTNALTDDEPTQQKPLRLWPGVVIVVLQWLARFVVPIVAPDFMAYGVMGALVGGLALAVWWVFFSRVPWSERAGVLLLMIVAALVTSQLIHVSIATGMMGMMFPIYVIPGLSLALVAWAAVSRHLSVGPRRAALAVAVLLACGVWTLVRTGGFSGNLDHDFAWRWAQTPEERLVAQAAGEPMAPTPAPASTSAGAEWPGFRGPGRDAVIRGAQVETDWSASPPVELWRRKVGPGWSSFAVRGDLLYTQEQRGDDEVVACYHATTGEPVWKHHDTARFWESNGGAGPRGTPTLSDDRVYTLGGTGILNALDAGDGTVVWSRDAAADTGAELPMWGFSGSPLVTGDVVIVAVSSALAAYDLATGDPRWTGPSGGTSYSSPHLATIDGVAQILQLNGDGLVGAAPGDGSVLWEHPWSGYPIVQPVLTEGGDVLISVSDSSGTRRLAVTQDAGGWTATERWTSIGLKPYFNGFVAHEGHAYGFDGNILSCIDLENGERQWKGGRYGGGQLVLLADQDLMLVLSEKGELALVDATPDRFTERARFSAIEGKTWSHPVLVDDLLWVRNAEEMAAFRLSRASG